MEILIGIVILIVIWNYVSTWFTDPVKPSQQPTFPSSENKDNNKSLTVTAELVPLETLETYPRNEPKKDNSTVINNYYVQNNVYVQQNPYSGKEKSSEESKGHSKAKWKALGFQVISGESYAYKMYGREIFNPDQVVKIGSSRQPLQLGYGLSQKQKKAKQLGYSLVEKVGSKRKAKDILVNKYDFDEETAKYAVGYNGYENW